VRHLYAVNKNLQVGKNYFLAACGGCCFSAQCVS
jgi:hypothetical protein